MVSKFRHIWTQILSALLHGFDQLLICQSCSFLPGTIAFIFWDSMGIEWEKVCSVGTMASSHRGCLVSITGCLGSRLSWCFTSTSGGSLGHLHASWWAESTLTPGSLMEQSPLWLCLSPHAQAHHESPPNTPTWYFAASLGFGWLSLGLPYVLVIGSSQCRSHTPSFSNLKEKKKTMRFSPKYFVFITNPLYSLRTCAFLKPRHWGDSFLSVCFSRILSLRTNK